MAESRKKNKSILLDVDGKIISIWLFDSRQWPDQSGDAGLYRVQINGKWHSPTGKYSFFTLAAVGEMAASLLASGDEPQEDNPPLFKKGQDVRVHVGECVSGIPIETRRGYVLDEPEKGIDGRWYVPVSLFSRRPVMIPACDVEEWQ